MESHLSQYTDKKKLFVKAITNTRNSKRIHMKM